MTYRQPLKQILTATQMQWDRPETRPAVRWNFKRVISCRTRALGAEVFGSETEEKVVFHTCKSRACPSCGHRATLLWQREQYAGLPEIPYVGITFTMPDVLWPLLRHNRRLLHDLAVLGAAAIQQWVKAKYGVRVLIIVVPHTFGRRLNFNAHLHILVSAGGLKEAEGRWTGPLRYHEKALMHMWRFAVITYLREAVQANLLSPVLNTDSFKVDLKKQYERWWNIDISHFMSKWQFLRYAGRYARRPPIAQHRFLKITDQHVEFSTKDLKEKRVVTTRYPTEKFVDILADHVPDRYQHTIRYFGLLAPRSKGCTLGAIFTLLGQRRQRPRSKRLNWRDSLRKCFGVDPLLDQQGQLMRWKRRWRPVVQ
jgi:hypothetical protein